MNTSIGILTVATNIYIAYWEQMVRSADRLLAPGTRKTFHVFTDQPERANALQRELHESRVLAMSIPAYGWPEATLLRYQLITEHADDLDGDILMHMDADLLAVAPVLDLNPAEWNSGLAFVRHPGFRRPGGWREPVLYLRYPRMLRRDIHMKRNVGALGVWEHRPESRAFVPVGGRFVYVYGAIWLGRRTQLLRMCSELADAVNQDLETGLIAEWHDESHLNRYASEHAHTLLDSDLCYVEGWPNLADLTPRILAVHKGSNLTR